MAENGIVPSKKIKDSKIQEEIMKTLNGITNPEEKFQALLKRTIAAEKINKTLVKNQKLFDSLQTDYQQTRDVKSKLESLCRELQKQNKSIKDESLSRIKEEEEKRKETQAKFQKSLNEIQKMMNENTEKNNKLKEDNLEMSNKFKYILEQYELREQQMDKINKQMDLVTQLNDAKLAKIQVELAAEREKFSKETAIYEDTIKILKHQLGESRTAEKLLKEQVDLYSGKYGEFQESLKKSHDVFEGYKTDMTKMSKKNIKMEKEMYLWKAKFEKSNALLLDLVSEKQVKDEHITKTARQMYHLQKLCRQLQFERTAFLTSLKENNIEIPVIPEAPKETKIELPPEPVVEPPPKVDDSKLDLMTKNCDQLKKNLAQLQGQLANLQSAESEEAAKPAAPTTTTTKKEKSKNKKAKKDKAKGASNEVEPEVNGKANGVEITENLPKEQEQQENLVKDETPEELPTKETPEVLSTKETVVETPEILPSNSEEVKPVEIETNLEKSVPPTHKSPEKTSNSNNEVVASPSSEPQQTNDQVTN